MRRPGIVFIICILGFTTLTAQQKWSLQQCVEYALDNNIQVKQQRLNIEVNEQDYLQSKLDVLPSLNGRASHGYRWGKTVDPFTNDFATDRVRSNSLGLNSSITLFNGFQKLNYIRQKHLTLMASKYDTDKFMDDISLNIATFYIQTLFYTEQLKTTRTQLEVTNQQVARTQKLVQAGTLAKGDLLTIEAQAATEELRVVQAQNNLAISYLNLTQLLDLPSTEGFEIETPQLEIGNEAQSLLNPQQVYNYSLENRPEIKSAELKKQITERQLAVAKGSQSVSLTLNGYWGSGYSGATKVGTNPFMAQFPIGVTESGENVLSLPAQQFESYNTKSFNDQLSDNVNKSLDLTLNIPLFNGWRTRSRIAVAKIGIENAQLLLELEQLNLYKVIHQAYADARAALQQYTAAQKKLSATQEAFKYAEQKFTVGMINSVEYNDAKKNMTNAEAEILNAKFDYIFKKTVLDFYMGKPLNIE